MHTELKRLTIARVGACMAANDAFADNLGLCPVVRRMRVPASHTHGFKQASNFTKAEHRRAMRSARAMWPIEQQAMMRWFGELTTSGCLRRYLRNGGHYLLINGGACYGA